LPVLLSADPYRLREPRKEPLTDIRILRTDMMTVRRMSNLGGTCCCCCPVEVDAPSSTMACSLFFLSVEGGAASLTIFAKLLFAGMGLTTATAAPDVEGCGFEG